MALHRSATNLFSRGGLFHPNRRLLQLSGATHLPRTGGGGGERRRRGGNGCSSDAPGAVQGPVPTNFPATNFAPSPVAPPSPFTDGSSTATARTMRSLTVAEAEAIYFRGSVKKLVSSGGDSSDPHAKRRRAAAAEKNSFCRLCQEEVVEPLTPRSHILASARSTYLSHICRETVLDTLILLLRRGYAVDNMVNVWSRVLYHHSAFPRIHALVNPDSPLQERVRNLQQLLKVLVAWGVIDVTFAVVSDMYGTVHDTTVAARRRQAMERAEIIGDNSHGVNTSHRMMALFPDKQFPYSQFTYNYNSFRDACEMNLLFVWMFDVLELANLFRVTHREKIADGKMKADIVEAMLGELQLQLFALQPGLHDYSCDAFLSVSAENHRHVMYNIVEHVVTELFDLMVLHFAEELSRNALPLAKEIASMQLWRTARTQFSRTKSKRFSGSAKARFYSSSTLAAAYLLPAVERLHAQPTPLPRSAANPLQMAGIGACRETVVEHTGRDCFEDFLPHISCADPQTFAETGVRVTLSHRQVAWWNLCTTLCPTLTCEAPLTNLAAASASDIQGSKTADATSESVSDSSRASTPSAAVVMMQLDDMDAVYFRDPLYDTTVSPLLAPDASRAMLSAIELLDLARQTAHPALSREPIVFQASASSEIDETMSDFSSSAADSPRFSCFCKSSLVPADMKRPSAGVVTDSNLHMGRYLFGETTLAALDEWRQRWADARNEFFAAPKSAIAAANREALPAEGVGEAPPAAAQDEHDELSQMDGASA